MVSNHKRKVGNDGTTTIWHIPWNIVSLSEIHPLTGHEKILLHAQVRRSVRAERPVYIHGRSLSAHICILTAVFGSTYRDMQNAAPSLNLPWRNEVYAEHTHRCQVHSRRSLEYFDDILIRSAYTFVWANQGGREVFGAHSTHRHRDRQVLRARGPTCQKREKRFELIRVKQYLKRHITTAYLTTS